MVVKQSLMKVNGLSNLAMSGHTLGSGYVSPKMKTVFFLPEGVLCASIYLEHQGFSYDEEEDGYGVYGVDEYGLYI